jgi:hypothetical protein
VDALSDVVWTADLYNVGSSDVTAVPGGAPCWQLSIMRTEQRFGQTMV